MLRSWVVELEFRASSPIAAVADTVVRIGRPRRSRDGSWRCLCVVAGLPALPALAPRIAKATSSKHVTITTNGPRAVRLDATGEDALQALMLGIQFIQSALESFTLRGGRLEYPDGTRVALGVYFPALRTKIPRAVI